jgi:hypothetical protein
MTMTEIERRFIEESPDYPYNIAYNESGQIEAIYADLVPMSVRKRPPVFLTRASREEAAEEARFDAFLEDFAAAQRRKNGIN